MNIINAIINLVNNPIIELVNHYQSHNRANQAGDALEAFVQDLFANTFNMDENKRLEKISEVFSYIGNASNPPDSMLKNGDAIEVKKIEKKNASLALNSSYPKAKLSSDNPMISAACKNAENWKEKDLIYIVGVVNDSKLSHLSMVYGEDYCAAEECYIRIKSTIKNGVESIPGVEFSATKELGRINKVDPLGITYLRVRGMWVIENPWTVFNYVYQTEYLNKFNFMAIINEDKWNSFENTKELLELVNDNLSITTIKIKDPNNPAKLKNAKLITYYQ